MYKYHDIICDAVQYRGGEIKEGEYPKWVIKAVEDGILRVEHKDDKWGVVKIFPMGDMEYCPQGSYIINHNGYIATVMQDCFEECYHEIL